MEPGDGEEEILERVEGKFLSCDAVERGGEKIRGGGEVIVGLGFGSCSWCKTGRKTRLSVSLSCRRRRWTGRLRT